MIQKQGIRKLRCVWTVNKVLDPCCENAGKLQGYLRGWSAVKDHIHLDLRLVHYCVHLLISHLYKNECWQFSKNVLWVMSTFLTLKSMSLYLGPLFLALST